MSVDRIKRIFLFVAMLLASNSGIWAQDQVECHLKADFVSDYIWRGQDLGNVSLQPELSVAWKGLSLAAWGSVGLFGIVDYWSEGNDSRYFFYKYGTGHAFEGFISYNFGPVSASWQTYFAGNDYQEDDGEYQSSNDKRAYSSYFGLSAPFRLATCDWEAEVGFVPWKSATYEVSSFNVTNLSLRATKAIQISQSFELPLFGQVIANPQCLIKIDIQ